MNTVEQARLKSSSMGERFKSVENIFDTELDVIASKVEDAAGKWMELV